MDPLTLQKIQKLIDSIRLTEFERLLVDYFFLEDHSHPTLTGFRRLMNISSTNAELQEQLSRVLSTLRGCLADHRINRLSDVM